MASILLKKQLRIYFVSDALSSGSNLDVYVHTDFKKAFDKINHILVFKQNDIDLYELLLFSIISFISYRS